jgi:hypothetical protein
MWLKDPEFDPYIGLYKEMGDITLEGVQFRILYQFKQDRMHEDGQVSRDEIPGRILVKIFDPFTLIKFETPYEHGEDGAANAAAKLWAQAMEYLCQ